MSTRDLYLEAWSAFRRYALWNVSLLPIIIVSFLLVGIFNHELTAMHMLIPGFVVVGALFVGFFVANYKLRRFRCPRCNHLWIVNAGLFAKCGVCGIVRGTPSSQA